MKEAKQTKRPAIPIRLGRVMPTRENADSILERDLRVEARGLDAKQRRELASKLIIWSHRLFESATLMELAELGMN